MLLLVNCLVRLVFMLFRVVVVCWWSIWKVVILVLWVCWCLRLCGCWCGLYSDVEFCVVWLVWWMCYYELVGYCEYVVDVVCYYCWL